MLPLIRSLLRRLPGKMSSVKSILSKKKPTPSNPYQEWCSLMVDYEYLMFSPALTNKEKGVLKKTFEVFGEDKVKVLRWFFENYDVLKKRLKDKGAFLKDIPTIQLLYFNRILIYNEYLEEHQPAPILTKEITKSIQNLISRDDAFLMAEDFAYSKRIQPVVKGGHYIHLYDDIINIPHPWDKSCDYKNRVRGNMGIMGCEVISPDTGEILWNPYIIGGNDEGFELVSEPERTDKITLVENSFGKDIAMRLYKDE